MTDRVLHQFPISHFCEKARWVLDHKGLPYRIHNQLPGLHARTNKRLTGQPTVPVLIDGEVAIGGSHAIALYLEQTYPTSARLVPEDTAARARLDTIVRYFDESVGPAVRRFVYSLVLARGDLFRDLFFGGYGPVARTIGSLMAGPVSKVIGRMYKVNEHSVDESTAVIRAAADYAEAELHPGRRYVLGDELSLADITVASLLAPLIGPPGSPWSFDLALPQFITLRDELRARPVSAYVTQCYRQRQR